MSTATTVTKNRLRHRRRPSANDTHDVPLLSCHSLPHSLEALDPSSSGSARQSLAALRFLLLSYLEDVENRLSTIDSPISEISIPASLKTKGEDTVEDARIWARDALEMLRSIRSDVCSYLPELPDVPSLSNVRAQFSNSLADTTSAVEDVCSRISDKHISALSCRFQSLQAHLTSMDVLMADLHTFPVSARLSGLFDSIMSSDLVTELSDDVTEAEDLARDVACAIKQSLQGSKLIHYVDLPPQWRNNPFVTRGYRFIPLEKWPLIVLSLFAWHNETLNIHTHFIPFILWFIHCIPIFKSPSLQDFPETAFVTFALVCLFTSVVWHTMSGCAHYNGMDLCARIDYVGIGWLISASVGTVVYYGFQCHPNLGTFFLICCFLTGVAGNVFPFLRWFNDPVYRHVRIVFFICMAFTAIAPLAVLAYLHSPRQVIAYTSPVVPSVISYLVGLVFYAFRIPECFLSERFSHWLDWCGGGSHAIWHTFIVLAISQHRTAIASLRGGISCAFTPT
ncbi:hemolysin-III related-domain-containing protein [Boletus edulis BED1]|uniref:Hemolysin-III related-domain-containing protein n=1 Tax=Boletus edulis BED1 TaxID=1328754 RepID=A0AAD4C053_BOLED|nr:hemolysin-III related-domain-containing protein [Boletus edulis BED1]